jgi:formylglycine-generating enzyme required for sulfatase activity
MEHLAQILFLSLDGHPAAPEQLDQLPDAAHLKKVLTDSFGRLMPESARLSHITAISEAPIANEGLILVYAFGHAWLTPDGPQTAVKRNGGNVLLTGAEIFRAAVPEAALDRTILVLDCCHAMAFNAHLPADLAPRLVVYACASNEKAISLLGERASRLSLALAGQLQKSSKSLDVVEAIGVIRKRLSADTVITGQDVSYRMNGLPIYLGVGFQGKAADRERSVSRFKQALVAGGSVFALFVVGLIWFYFTHIYLTVELAGLNSISSNIQVSAMVQRPNTNEQEVVQTVSVSGVSTRFWIPADNVIIRVSADFGDSRERQIAYHLDLKSSLSPSGKLLTLTLPPAAEVKAHPDMAFIPQTQWYHGREREKRTSDTSYWIDIRPPTVQEYLPIVLEKVSKGKLAPDNSFLVTFNQRQAAVVATGTEQLNQLSSDLGDIFGKIDQANSEHVSAPADIVVGTGEVPCEMCPAPMTKLEAKLYCEDRGMRLPTDLEWELAVRGVDGRDYPWGNRFDESKANVPGMPDKGQEPPALKPVDAYPNERSPYGLIDTVGNAGDWIDEGGDDEGREYMGATFQYNQEDATTFRMLPVTEMDYLIRSITARCVGLPK